MRLDIFNKAHELQQEIKYFKQVRQSWNYSDPIYVNLNMRYFSNHNHHPFIKELEYSIHQTLDDKIKELLDVKIETLQEEFNNL